jgi:DNA-binding NtrC family response regulator
VVPIGLPPLRERSGDVAELTGFFVDKFNKRLKKAVKGVETDAMELLERYRWPGNVRELENIIERAVLFADGARIGLGDLPSELSERDVDIVQLGIEDTDPVLVAGDGLKAQVKAATSRIEKDLILRALRQTHGNVTHAARLLKISRKGLQLKMKELDLRDGD